MWILYRGLSCGIISLRRWKTEYEKFRILVIIYDMLWDEFTIRRWGYIDTIMNLTLLLWHCEDVMNLTLWFQRCSGVVNTGFIAHSKLNLRSNVESTLEQRCNFDVMKIAAALCIGCTMLQPYHNVVTTLCICWIHT